MDALLRVCSWNTNGIMVRAWMLCSAYALGTRTELWFGPGWSAQRMLLEHERNYGLGMDGIMVGAWMLWSADALGTRKRRARALDAPGAKFLVSPSISPIVVPTLSPL